MELVAYSKLLTRYQIRQGALWDKLHPIPGDAAYCKAGEALVITVNVLVQSLRPPHRATPLPVQGSRVLAVRMVVLVEVPGVQLPDVLHQGVSLPLRPDQVLDVEFSYIGAVARLWIGCCEQKGKIGLVKILDQPLAHEYVKCLLDFGFCDYWS